MRVPLVSIGLPLYRSSRFLDIIEANLAAVDYPNIEVIISDRHLDDDALATLRERFRADPRVRFLEGTDQLNWVQHFNLLLREAHGTYFLWMGHDDSYPGHYITDLVSELERHPEAVLAFGRVEQVSLDGFLPTFPFVPPPVNAEEPWSIEASVRMLTLWQLWIAFRGVFRRETAVAHDLSIRETYRNVRADIYWVFALSLFGSLRYVPTCHCTKRFHRSSGGASWRFGIRQGLNACRVLRSYLRDYGAPGLFRARAVIYAWCVVQGVLPAAVAKPLGVVVRRVMRGR
jgi:glycosyltransferase involved in cell wall biosynthesis